MGMILFLILLALLLYLANHYYSYRKLVSEAQSLPVPIIYQQYEFPLVGVIKYFFEIDKNKIQNFVMDFYKKKKEPIVQVISGNYYRIWILDEKLAKEILTKKEKNFLKPDFYSFIEVFGKNLVTLNGKEWARQRNIFNPLFSIDEHLNSVVNASTEYTHRLIDHSLQKDTTDFEVKRGLHDLALDVISDVAFGYDIHATDNRSLKDFNKDQLPENVTLTLKESLELSLQSLVYHHLFGEKLLRYVPIKKIQRILAAVKDFESYMDFFIEKYEVKRNSVLEMMVKHQNSEQLNTRDIKGNMFIFFFAGHETTAGTLHWTLLYLSKHQDIQEKLFQQVYSVLKGRDPKFSDLENLTYPLWVFKETLRLFPPLKNLEKQTSGPIQLGGVDFPEKSNFTIFLPSIHKNPDLWDNPDTFNPDRFSENHDPSSFIPFSFGPRNCIGYKFAEIEATIVLSILIQKYSFHFKDGVSEADYLKEYSLFTTCPYNNINIIAKKRGKFIM